MKNTFNKNNIQSDSSTTTFKLTVFGCSNTTLNKTITLEDGKLKKKANSQFLDGVVQVVEQDGLEGFKSLLEENHTELAYALGRPHRGGKWLDKADVRTTEQLDGREVPNVISRSKDHFAFREKERGVLLLDIDGEVGSPDEILQTLYSVFPKMRDSGCLIVHSSSSHIKDASTGKMLSGTGGLHIYFLVENAADIPRFGDVLCKRLWLNGHGRIEISKAGSFLVRQPVDAAVFSPERLIFEAPPKLGEGLVQERPPIELREGGILDTESLKGLTGTELSQYLLMVNEAKAEKEALASEIREQWLDERVEEIVNTTGCDMEVARKEAKKLLTTDQLPNTYVFHFDRQGQVTVGDVLADPDKYDRQTMADPVEPNYNGGRNIAIFYWNNGHPLIHSHAHGGKVYRFASMQSDEAVFRQAVEDAKTDAGAHWNAEVIVAAGNVYQKDRAEYQRLRSALKENCKNAEITKWEKMVINKGDDGHEDIATKLVNMVNVVSETFHDKKNIGYITIRMGDHQETWSLDSTGFYEWLEYFAYTNLDSVPSETTLKSVITALHGQAKHDGEQHDVFTRCAPYKNGYLIDLTNDLWQVIYVTPDGWEIIDESPVKFIRSQTAVAFPTPVKNGSINDFWNHVNIPEECRTLVLAFMLDSWRPDTDFPILELTGEHGTAKSSTHTRIRQLTDPNSVPLRSAPKDVQDIFVSAGMNWQASFENMSYLPNDMQDGLCTLSTGGGFATRRLYTNAEESVIDVKRPCIINGISAVATRPDLIDRIIHLDLPKLEKYISKQEMDQWFEEAWPGLFGGLLDVFSQTLKHLPHVRIHELPRMGDFALLGQALHVALRDDRPFIDVYKANRSDSLHASLEACPVALAVWKFAKELHEPWTGTTMELKGILDDLPHDYEGWPRSPKGLGAALRRMGPALREVGVEIHTVRRNNGFNLTITYFSDEENFQEQRSQRSLIPEDMMEVLKF
jgi:hypothetical protein